MGTISGTFTTRSSSAQISIQSTISHVNASFTHNQQSGMYTFLTRFLFLFSVIVKQYSQQYLPRKCQIKFIKNNKRCLRLVRFQGSLVVWDVRTGEPVREVRLGHTDSCIFVKQMLALKDSVVCDFGRQLRVVRFPLVSDKLD